MSTSDSSFLARRIDSATLPMAVGDLLVISLLLTAGVINHNSVDYLSADPVGWLLTLVPFLLGWAIVAPLVGAYSPGAAESAKAAIPLSLRAWIPADVVGAIIRWTPFFEGGATPLVDYVVFVLVTMVFGLVGLGVWRYVYFKVR